jgi:hypothetical protein
MAHENTSQSPLIAFVVDSCSVLQINEFKVDSSALTTSRQVKKLKNGKAPGFDGVPNILLKNLPRRAIVYLTYVINTCIKLCCFPKESKHASVIPIPKPGKDNSNPSNYRLISLLSSISKASKHTFFEKCSV